jgi:energy-coupling factor transport system permease protein
MNVSLFTHDHARPWLLGLDPRTKLAWVVAISIAAATIDSTSELTALAIVAASAAVSGLRLDRIGWAAIVGVLLFIVWGTMLSQGFFFGGPDRVPLVTFVAPRKLGGYDFPGISIAAVGLEYGAVQSLRVVATALSGIALALSTSPERLLAALARLRLPNALGYMTTAALRFVPVVIDEALTVRRARTLRGYRFDIVGAAGDRLGPYKHEFSLLLPVIAASLRRAETLAESVTARGFDPAAPRTFYPPLRMTLTEKILVAALAIGCAALIVRKTMS